MPVNLGDLQMSFQAPALPALPESWTDAQARALHFEQVVKSFLASFSTGALEALDKAITNGAPLPFAQLEQYREQIGAFLSDLIVAIKFAQALAAASAVPMAQ
jgi:hypothetical protein